MGRKKTKAPTWPVRVYKDKADDLTLLAGFFGKDIADLVDKALAELIAEHDSIIKLVKSKRAEVDSDGGKPRRRKDA